MGNYKFTYMFRITPYHSWHYYEVEAKGANEKEAKEEARKQFKLDHPDEQKFRITRIKDWRIGCSMYD